MKLAGFSLRKITIEKFSDSFADLKINTNVEISSIERVSSEFAKEDEAILATKFVFSVDYDPKIAKIEFLGTILIMVSEEKAKEVLEKWKDKKIQDDIKLPLFNTILSKSNVKALQYEDELNLPLHVPFRLLTKDEKNKF